MGPLIRNLKSATFYELRFNRREISDIQEAIALFPANTRNGLARTICEHLNRYNPGTNLPGGQMIHNRTGTVMHADRQRVLLPAA